jgi:YHS domain-containing protein
MTTRICPTCGCSLVRLGIPNDQQPSLNHDGVPYRFCCTGCSDLFAADPDRYVRETANLVVCPTCLAEKPISATVAVEMNGGDQRFCRCPGCIVAFRKNPTFYLQRLQGEQPHAGVFAGPSCC